MPNPEAMLKPKSKALKMKKQIVVEKEVQICVEIP